MFVRFTADWQQYQGGDVRDFDKQYADQLIADGKAVYAGSRDQNSLSYDPVSGALVDGAGIPQIKIAQGRPLVKNSSLQMDYTDPSITWGYSNCTSALDKAYQRFSNYSLRLDITNNSAQILKGSRSITCDPTDQMLALDIYIPFLPQTGSGGHSMNILVTNATGYSGNNITFSFDANYLRQGWNSLRMWAGDTNGASGTGTLATGAVKASNGSGCDMAANIGYFEVTFNNMNGKSVYLGQVRRAAKVTPMLVMGFDATGTGTGDNVMVDKVAPLFAEFGRRGYFTVTNIYDMLYAGGADDLRKRTLYNTYGWDAINHTWNHGATRPGGSATVTLSRTSNVVTATWGAAHSFTVGEKFHMAFSGGTPSDMMGVYEVTVTTTTAVTYTAAGANGSSSGTVTASTMLADVVAAPSTLSTQIMTHEVVDIASVMRTVGFNRGSNCGAWPNNSVGDLATVQAACAAAKIGLFRGIRSGTVKVDEFGVDNPYHLGSVEMGSGSTATTLQNLKDKLAGAIARGEPMITYGHYILDETDPANIAHVNANLEYAPGAGGNPAPPAAGAQGGGGGWWYLGTLRLFLQYAAGVEGKTMSELSAALGIPQ